MKRIFFLAVASAIFFSYCRQHVENIPPPLPPLTLKPFNYLIASAGADTTICMPYGGTGNMFKGMLDGRASVDDSGKIVSWSWYEIMGSPPNLWLEIIGNGNIDSNTIYSHDSAVVSLLLPGGVHQFMLKLRDDHGRVDSSEVIINAVQNFDAEYDGLSWDSATGLLNTISVKAKPGLLESWPDFHSAGYH
jgi:hypothetical protein